MKDNFISVVNGIQMKLWPYQTKLMELDVETITTKKNSQNRTIKQIVGHMIDSASNNTHRIIHLQYRDSPVDFPNYASNGNNDHWISIQNYQEENWYFLIDLWKFSHLHILHVIKNIDEEYHEKEWISGPGKTITLEEMVLDFLPHFELHLAEIDDIIIQ
jgi:hypothetical protein